MFFVGRNKELSELSYFYNRKQRNLIAVIGRRGIGKTALLNKFKEIIEYDDGALCIQLKGNKFESKFVKIKNALFDLSIIFKFDLSEVKHIKDWKMFFHFFEKQLDLKLKENTGRKIVVFIDEFAWFHNKSSNFVEYFADFYDRLINRNILFVVTASAVSWMNKNVIKSSGGLHGKVHAVQHLKPFSLIETIEYLKTKSNGLFNTYQYIQYYLYTGGVVRYLEKIQMELSVQQNAVKIFTSFNNIDHKEFNDLFSSTFDSNSESHKKIVLSFQQKRKLSLTEIQKITGLDYVTVKNAVDDLVCSDLLIGMDNYGNKKKDKSYLLIDLFCYYNIKMLNNVTQLDSFFNAQSKIIDGFALEILVANNVDLIKKEVGTSGFNSQNYSWVSPKKDAQIDLILEYKISGRNFHLIEVKNYEKQFNLNQIEADNIINKIQSFSNYLIKNKNYRKFDIGLVFVSLFGINNVDGRLNYIEVRLDDVVKKYL